MLYDEIAQHYRGEILAGRLLPGDRLPTNDEIRTIFNASQSTVTNALKMLIAEGLVSGRRSGGTLVLKRPGVIVTGPQRWERVQRGGEHLTQGENSTQRTAEMVPANPEVARTLEVPVHVEVVLRTRVFTQDGVPTCYALSWIHPRILLHVPELIDVEMQSRNWQSLYTERTGVEIAKSLEMFGARLLETPEKKALKVTGDHIPVSVLHTVFRDEEGPVEFWKDVCAPGIWMSRS